MGNNINNLLLFSTCRPVFLSYFRPHVLTFDASHFDLLLALLIISLIGGMTTSLTSIPAFPPYAV